MNKAFLMTGGNMGNTAHIFAQAYTLIEQRLGKIVKESSLYKTAAWGIENQRAFLNQALVLETPMSASVLLEALLSIESALGRVRHLKYGERIIDIDILFFNEDIISTPSLTIPHPQLHKRRFVLEPLSEIAPDFVHPLLNQSISFLLTQCDDPLDVQKL